MKNLTKRLFALLTAAVILLGAGTSFSYDERTESFDLKPGQKVNIELKSGGSIIIKGWNKSKAEVTYYDHKQGLGPYHIELESHNRKGLKIVAFLEDKEVNNNNLNFELRVPQEIVLEFFTAGGGLTLKDVAGDFSGRTMGGGISLDNVKGDVNIETMGGAIEVLDSEVDGKIHTMGGRALVKDVVGNIRVSSNGGNVQYINVRKTSGGIAGPGRGGDEVDADVTGKTVQIKSMGGGIDVDEAPEGAVVFTAGGKIKIRNAVRFVKAQTGGGDIKINIEHGWVKASTGAGDVDIVIGEDRGDDGDVSVLTGTGDVSVTVPPGFSMELDIDLGYTRNSDQDYRIYSDFDFDEKRTREWDHSQGTPRKHIYGTGKIAGGKHRIKIRTVNGDVYIKKSK